MAREDPQLKIRLPEALKAELEEAATLAGRSVNAEVVTRLQASFAPQRDMFAVELQAIVRDVAAIKRGMAASQAGKRKKT